MVFTHRRGGLVFCASDCSPCYGDHVHGHEQRNNRSDGRNKEDARTKSKDINSDAG